MLQTKEEQTTLEEMDDQQLREAGAWMINYFIDYMNGIRDRDVLPTVEPGYLRERYVTYICVLDIQFTQLIRAIIILKSGFVNFDFF